MKKYRGSGPFLTLLFKQEWLEGTPALSFISTESPTRTQSGGSKWLQESPTYDSQERMRATSVNCGMTRDMLPKLQQHMADRWCDNSSSKAGTVDPIVG